MTSRIARWRLHRLGLSSPAAATPLDALRFLTAAQARDSASAWSSLAQRTSATATAKDIDQLYDDGAILRTHVLRPTRQLVAREDIRSLLRWTAPGVQAAHGPSYRRNGLDDVTLARSDEVLADALTGKHLSTAQLGEALHRGGIAGAAGERLANLLLHAELSAVMCSGPTLKGTPTYALLDERIPGSPAREDPAELVLRYVASHGPVSARSCTWWTGLAPELVTEVLQRPHETVMSEVIDDVTWWFAAGSEPTTDPASPFVRLLMAGDEYAVGYGPAGVARDDSAPRNLVILDGQVAGQWRRTVRKSHVAIDVVLDRQWGRRELRELSVQADRHGDFLGLRTRLTAAAGPTVIDSLTAAARDAAPWLFPG